MGLANYWGQGGGVVQRVGVICHFPQSPKRVSTLSSSLGYYILVLLHTHRGTTQVRSQGCWACFLRLTSCPPSLGTEDAESETGVTVGDKERSEICRSRRRGIRDELQGWQPDWNQRWRNQRSGQDWGVIQPRQRWWRLLSVQEGILGPLPYDS